MCVCGFAECIEAAKTETTAGSFSPFGGQAVQQCYHPDVHIDLIFNIGRSILPGLWPCALPPHRIPCAF